MSTLPTLCITGKLEVIFSNIGKQKQENAHAFVKVTDSAEFRECNRISKDKSGLLNIQKPT